MRKAIAVHVGLVFLLCVELGWAGGMNPEIELANANVILEKVKKVDEAKAKLDKAEKQDDAKQLSKQLSQYESDLAEAISSSFGGTTKDAVEYAKLVVKREELKKRLDSERDKEKQSPIEEIAKRNTDDLEAIGKGLGDQRRLKNLADERFAGFNFGVALGVTVKAGKRDLVQSASLDANGIVRIDRDNNTTANLILESHYFFTPKVSFLGLVDTKNWGHGPFIAVQPGTENIIQSVGCGWMIGFKRSSIIAPDLARDRGDSFNIGAGIMVNPNAQVLGDGIQKNQPLPAGETSVRLRTTTEMGWLVTFSYSF